MTAPAFLTVNDLALSRKAGGGVPFRRPAPRSILRNVSFVLHAGECVGLVGKSGSGKTTLLRCLLAIDTPDHGLIACEGQPVRPGSVAKLRWYRRAVQYVPQDPSASLDPRMPVLSIVMEPLRRLKVECRPESRAEEALEKVGLDRSLFSRRPQELSGGQAQRVAIARAIATRPTFLLTDEPVSGLDMPTRDQVVSVLRDLVETHGMGLMIVSHDLSVVAGLCRRTLVMDDGEIVEDAPTGRLLAAPKHPATRELIAAAPPLHMHV